MLMEESSIRLAKTNTFITGMYNKAIYYSNKAINQTVLPDLKVTSIRVRFFFVMTRLVKSVFESVTFAAVNQSVTFVSRTTTTRPKTTVFSILYRQTYLQRVGET